MPHLGFSSIATVKVDRGEYSPIHAFARKLLPQANTILARFSINVPATQ